MLAEYKNRIYCVATQRRFLRKTQRLDAMASGSVRTAPEPPVRLPLSASEKTQQTIINDRCGRRCFNSLTWIVIQCVCS